MELKQRIINLIQQNTASDAADKIISLFEQKARAEQSNVVDGTKKEDNDFSMHQHWKDEDVDDDGGVIKHFQD